MEACLPGVRVELAQGAQESGQSPLQAEILGCIEYSIQPQITLFATIHKPQRSRSAIQ